MNKYHNIYITLLGIIGVLEKLRWHGIIQFSKLYTIFIGLVRFYGISTLIGYLMPNFLKYILYIISKCIVCR